MLGSLLLLAVLAGPSEANPYSDAPSLIPSLDTTDPFSWEVTTAPLLRGQSARLEVKLVVPPGTHVYRDQVEVAATSAAGLKFGKPDFPPGRLAPDPANKKHTREIYDVDVVVWLPVSVPKKADLGLTPIQLQLRHQGCREGLCFPPSDATQTVMAPVRDPEAGS